MIHYQEVKTALLGIFGSGGIRTHASEETGALNQRLRPLGHATFYSLRHELYLWGIALLDFNPKIHKLEEHLTGFRGSKL